MENKIIQKSLIRRLISFCSYKYTSFLGLQCKAFKMENLALWKFSCMNRHTARLQWAQSQLSSSPTAFSQQQLDFQKMPMEKYASPRFLNSFACCLNFRHSSKVTIDSEYRPSLFKAALLLILKCQESSLDVSLWDNFSSTLLQIVRHSLGLSDSRYKYDKYQAAERLSSAYWSADQRQGMAYYALTLRDLTNKAIDFDSGSESQINSSLLSPFLTGLKAINYLLYFGFEPLESDLQNSLDLNLYFNNGDTHSSVLLPSSFSSTGTIIVFWATCSDSQNSFLLDQVLGRIV